MTGIIIFITMIYYILGIANKTFEWNLNDIFNTGASIAIFLCTLLLLAYNDLRIKLSDQKLELLSLKSDLVSATTFSGARTNMILTSYYHLKDVFENKNKVISCTIDMKDTKTNQIIFREISISLIDIINLHITNLNGTIASMELPSKELFLFRYASEDEKESTDKLSSITVRADSKEYIIEDVNKLFQSLFKILDKNIK